MTGLDHIVDLARRNFERVQASLDRDLAAARTPAAAGQVRRNRDLALAVYMDLIGRSLDAFTGDWDTLSGRAVAATAAIDAALEGARERAEILRLAADATTAFGDIVKAFEA